jgi:hypothetical protein
MAFLGFGLTSGGPIYFGRLVDKMQQPGIGVSGWSCVIRSPGPRLGVDEDVSSSLYWLWRAQATAGASVLKCGEQTISIGPQALPGCRSRCAQLHVASLGARLPLPVCTDSRCDSSIHQASGDNPRASPAP